MNKLRGSVDPFELEGQEMRQIDILRGIQNLDPNDSFFLTYVQYDIVCDSLVDHLLRTRIETQV